MRILLHKFVRESKVKIFSTNHGEVFLFTQRLTRTSASQKRKKQTQKTSEHQKVQIAMGLIILSYDCCFSVFIIEMIS